MWKSQKHHKLAYVVNAAGYEKFAGRVVKVLAYNFCGKTAGECMFPKYIDSISILTAESWKGGEYGFAYHYISDLLKAQHNDCTLYSAYTSWYSKECRIGHFQYGTGH